MPRTISKPAARGRKLVGKPIAGQIKAHGKSTIKQKVRATDDEIITAVDRAAEVLLAFTQSWDFLTLPEVANRSGLSKPTTFRILATLVAEGLVFQNEANGTYGLGALNLRLADVILSGMSFHESARSVMRLIRNQVNETVVLSVREGDACYYVDRLESRQSIGHSQPIGIALPLHTVAPGRAILASIADDAVDAYLNRAHLAGKRAPEAVNSQQLLQQIEMIRRQGFAVSSGETAGGGHTVAVAIPDSENESVSALHISFPQGRFTNELEQRCIDGLKRAVVTISARADG